MVFVSISKRGGEEDLRTRAWGSLQYSNYSAAGPDAVSHEGMTGCCSVLSTVIRMKRSLVCKMKEHTYVVQRSRSCSTRSVSCSSCNIIELYISNNNLDALTLT